MKFQIDKSKAINSMLYIIQKLEEMDVVPTMHTVMKLMYFADQNHLVTYGVPITGDTYQKMKYGPVPSYANYVAKDEVHDKRGIITKRGKNLFANFTPDMDDLSISEVKSLDYSIKEFANYSFKDLTDISHKYAWEKSTWDIDYLKIAKEGGADDNMLSFIQEQIINSNVSFC